MCVIPRRVIPFLKSYGGLKFLRSDECYGRWESQYSEQQARARQHDDDNGIRSIRKPTAVPCTLWSAEIHTASQNSTSAFEVHRPHVVFLRRTAQAHS